MRTQDRLMLKIAQYDLQKSFQMIKYKLKE